MLERVTEETMRPKILSDEELLKQYWDAQAQFGPFDVPPEYFLRECRKDERIAALEATHAHNQQVIAARKKLRMRLLNADAAREVNQ